MYLVRALFSSHTPVLLSHLILTPYPLSPYLLACLPTPFTPFPLPTPLAPLRSHAHPAPSLSQVRRQRVLHYSQLDHKFTNRFRYCSTHSSPSPSPLTRTRNHPTASPPHPHLYPSPPPLPRHPIRRNAGNVVESNPDLGNSKRDYHLIKWYNPMPLTHRAPLLPTYPPMTHLPAYPPMTHLPTYPPTHLPTYDPPAGMTRNPPPLA